MRIAIDLIKLDPDLQPRVALDQATINEYAEAMKEGDQFPSVVVFYDGAAHWLADGYHRVHAAKLAGTVEIEADVRNGTKKDALLFSVSSNATHGLRRTQADKRRAVMALLADPELSKESDRKLGKIAHVDNKTVAKYRAELGNSEEFLTLAEIARHTPLSIEALEFFRYTDLPYLLSMFGELPDDYKQKLVEIAVPEIEKFVVALKKSGIKEISEIGRAHV